jgi:hypothetical protein
MWRVLPSLKPPIGTMQEFSHYLGQVKDIAHSFTWLVDAWIGVLSILFWVGSRSSILRLLLPSRKLTPALPPEFLSLCQFAGSFSSLPVRTDSSILPPSFTLSALNLVRIHSPLVTTFSRGSAFGIIALFRPVMGVRSSARNIYAKEYLVCIARPGKGETRCRHE